jgi:hypothetical protein
MPFMQWSTQVGDFWWWDPSIEHTDNIIVITKYGLESIRIFKCAVGVGVAIPHHETRSAKTARVCS